MPGKPLSPALMNTNAFLLVIAGATLHAIWNLCAKKASGGLPFVWLYGVVSIVVALPFGVMAWCSHAGQLTTTAWIAIVASAFVHVGYSLILQKGYQKSDFSLVYPLARGTGPLFAVGGAVLLLGETPSLTGYLGIAAILAGILLLAGIGDLAHSDPQTRRAGLLWWCLTGLSIASYTLIDGWAVKTLGLAPVLYYVLGLALRTLILAPQALHARQELHEQWQTNGRYIVAVGILSPLSFTLALFAMTLAPLAYVAPLRELSMLLGVVFAAWLLREALTPGRIIGTLCMILGAALLAGA